MATTISATALELGYTKANQAKDLRACMVCSIIQLQSTFVSSGCPNCEPILDMKNSQETVSLVTSANFNGTIAVMNPSSSWVARWQRVDGYVQGIYAVQVIGTLPDEFVELMREQGLRYVPRDGPHDGAEDGER